MSDKLPGEYQTEDFVTDESFINYFFRLNREDELFWEKWLASHPEISQSAEAAKEMLRSLSLTVSDEEAEEELARLKKAINYDIQISEKKRPGIIRFLTWSKAPGVNKLKTKKLVKYGLPLLLVFIAAGYFLTRHVAMQPGQLTEKFNDSSKPIVFTLSDGTVVTLAPQSVFRYPAAFGNKERKVYLDGEAQFHVKRDEAHPFKVYEENVMATVLGTVFNVKKQSGDSVVLVELIKGKLKVETIDSTGVSTQSIILNPDERVIYIRHSQKLYKEKWQSQNDLPTQINHLVFRQNSFEDIAKQLKTAFGITVINQSKKKNWSFTGEFNNTSAINILESICIVEKLNYVIKGDTVIIK